MSTKTTEEILIKMFGLSGLPADEIESTVKMLIKNHGLTATDNDKNKIIAKMLGQVPKVFPKQAQPYSSIPTYYDHLVDDPKFNVVKHKQDAQSPPTYLPLSPPLHPDIVAKLTQQGRQQLYSHQVHTIELIRQGKHVLITTPTASGKSYGYVLPFLDAVKKDPATTGLFIFPMNALTNDQFDKLSNFGIGTVAKYDGTVKSHQKKKIRANPPNALLTNPDQIHSSILRKHDKWADFFKNLKFIVIDEIHNYKGFFGSNVSNILFRLLDVVKKAGGNPQIICTSATIANAKAFAKKLAWVDFDEVSRSGAGSPEKYYVMLDSIKTEGIKIGQTEEEWVAGILEKVLKKSPVSLLHDLVLSLGDNGFQSMIFVNSRIEADLLRDAVQYLAGNYTNLKSEMVCSYHAGLSNDERINIEHGIKTGDKRIIFTTSALELGIDIGSLDVCILYGLPKTSNEIWQRIGRVGRDPAKAALAIIVNSYSADDIYYFFNPDKFFKTKDLPEEPVIFPYNKTVRKLHLQCGYLEGMTIQNVTDQNIWNSIDTTLKKKNAYPRIPIRNSWYDPFTLIDGNGKKMGTIEYERVYREFHPGAIHRTESSTYKLKSVDYKKKLASFIKLENPEYYTSPVVKTTVDVEPGATEQILNIGNHQLLIGRGILNVHLSVGAYLRIYLDGREKRGFKLKNKRERKFKTEGFWISLLPGGAKKWDSVIPEFSNTHGFSVFHSLEHLLLREVIEKGYCDTSDIISLTYSEHYKYRNPAIFFYDNCLQGLGLCEQIFDNIESLINRAYIRISSCACADGCPACDSKRAHCEHREDFTSKDLTKTFLMQIALLPSTRSRYIDKLAGSKIFTLYTNDKFKVGDEYAPGYKVIEKNDVEYIIENAAGDTAYCEFEDDID
jgi:DEAD/DEAH box helicase domain-containing protein